MNLAELYEIYRANSNSDRRALALLVQTHWFVTHAEFDPKTGEALPQALSTFLANVARQIPAKPIRDRLWRITEHSRTSIERLLASLNESPRREQALLPVHAVRELDANSFIKLSNRPGRNIREKLASKPYLHAVRRFQSVDLPENRLLKAFVIHLAELLELRREYLHETTDDLMPKIQSWLCSGEAQAIGKWDNLPPNNTLLSHRDYRRVWDAWRWLQTLDDDIAHDLSQYTIREKTLRQWMLHARMWLEGKHLFAEEPLIFDYEAFAILPWSSPQPLFKESVQNIPRNVEISKIEQPVCLDLIPLRPQYAVTTGIKLLPYTFLWQQWKKSNQTVEIGLFNSDAAYLHSEATTISSADLFFTKNNSAEQLDAAAHAFASKLRDTFKHDTLIWLTPDFINDFELEAIRRNLNAYFTNAEPLPRSVAAVFEKIDNSRIKDGFPVIVVDTIGGSTCVTKLIARFDPRLEECLPETKGFYWERQPPVILESITSEHISEKKYEFTTVDDNGQWCNATQSLKPQFVEPSILKGSSRIGSFAHIINLIETPVAGGIHLHALQQSTDGIPLWRDQIPVLSIRVLKDGRYQRFYLVSRGTTVRPIRGTPVPITVSEDFTLPAGKSFYQFPLFLGESADDLGFSVRLDSPTFPLANDVVCKLTLSFEYGADEPYKLLFTPRDKSFPPIRATWQRIQEAIVTDAPSPDYPTPMTWTDLRSVPKLDSNETSDLLEWVQDSITRMDQHFYIHPKPRTTGVISKEWRSDKNGGRYTFATCNVAVETLNRSNIISFLSHIIPTSAKAHVEEVFIHENSFVHGLNYTDFTVGKGISFELQRKEKGNYAWKVAGIEYKEKDGLKNFDEKSAWDLVSKIRKRLYFPVIQVWRDGRSVDDQECPIEFAAAMERHVAYFVTLLKERDLPESIKHEIRFLLSCMHKDAPDECIQWIIEQGNNNILDKRAVGFALGDVSEHWQKDLLSNLVVHPTNDTIRVISYAIWREQNFVEKLSFTELQSILKHLDKMLAEVKSSSHIRARDMIELLELLLGLLRTRASSNPEIKMLLQPHQKITKSLTKQVERITELVAVENIHLFSRVQISLQKPKGDRTPDLLYALRLYLTGDDGANAIHISSVSDSESD